MIGVVSWKLDENTEGFTVHFLNFHVEQWGFPNFPGTFMRL